MSSESGVVHPELWASFGECDHGSIRQLVAIDKVDGLELWASFGERHHSSVCQLAAMEADRCDARDYPCMVQQLQHFFMRCL
jgi:hypothetical protein